MTKSRAGEVKQLPQGPTEMMCITTELLTKLFKPDGHSRLECSRMKGRINRERGIRRASWGRWLDVGPGWWAGFGYGQRKVEFPGGSDSKESTCDARDPGSVPGSGRSPGEGNGYPLQYSYLENSLDRGAWQATVHQVAKSRTWLSDWHIHKGKWGTRLAFHLQTFAFVDVFASSHSSSQDRLIRIPQGSSQTLPFQKHLPWSPFPASYFF